MKASDAKPLIGKLVEYQKRGWPWKRRGIVLQVTGRNIILDDDALWAPDIVSMELVKAPGEQSGHG